MISKRSKSWPRKWTSDNNSRISSLILDFPVSSTFLPQLTLTEREAALPRRMASWISGRARIHQILAWHGTSVPVLMIIWTLPTFRATRILILTNYMLEVSYIYNPRRHAARQRRLPCFRCFRLRCRRKVFDPGKSRIREPSVSNVNIYEAQEVKF